MSIKRGVVLAAAVTALMGLSVPAHAQQGVNSQNTVVFGGACPTGCLVPPPCPICPAPAPAGFSAGVGFGAGVSTP